MKEYIELGHMRLVNTEDLFDQPVYYIPHHAVINETNITTKLRVVFDDSCKTTNGLSLNDHCLAGPNLQMDLFSILLRFRCHKYVLAADISKMYRQILLDEAETSL